MSSQNVASPTNLTPAESQEVLSQPNPFDSPPHRLAKLSFWGRQVGGDMQGNDGAQVSVAAELGQSQDDVDMFGPSPPSPLSRDILRGQLELADKGDTWNEANESEPPTDDETCDPPPHPSSSSSVLEDGQPLSARLTRAAEGMRPARTYKYGSCPRHHCALKPHIYGPSSQKRGQAALVCSKFWKRDPSSAKPMCWYFRLATTRDLQSFPRCVREHYYGLKNRLLRGGR